METNPGDETAKAQSRGRPRVPRSRQDATNHGRDPRPAAGGLEPAGTCTACTLSPRRAGAQRRGDAVPPSPSRIPRASSPLVLRPEAYMHPSVAWVKPSKEQLSVVEIEHPKKSSLSGCKQEDASGTRIHLHVRSKR